MAGLAIWQSRADSEPVVFELMKKKKKKQKTLGAQSKTLGGLQQIQLES